MGLIVAGLLVGCASEPPVAEPTSAPEAGDSVEQVVRRGYQVAAAYAFAVEGHQYAYLKTQSGWPSRELIFIDGRLACGDSPERMFNALPVWEWVAEPDGLTYLASRMRQECELERPTPPRILPSMQAVAADVTRSAAEAPADASVPPSVAEPPSAGKEAAMMLGKILIGVPLGIMAAPYVIAGETAAIILGSPFVIAENSANKHQLEQRQLMRLGLTREETVALLGNPEIEFPLAAVGTTVLMYQAGKGTKYYVGLESGHVIWIHDSYPWLNRLAKQAKEDQKNSK